ncbi:MAG: hypothetical protein U5M23_00390 [Marinagarivorans sp.]|nr:hypothetical protein [Marinagarivorans sp.]
MLTIEEVQAQIDQKLTEQAEILTAQLTESTQTAITKATTGLGANLTREIKALSDAQKSGPTKGDSKGDKDKRADEDDDSPSSLAMEALKTQLSDLTQRLEAQQAELTIERQQAFNAAATAALTTAINASNAQHQPLLAQVLGANYSGKLQQEDGAWFVADGGRTVPIDDAVKRYLETDIGKIFVPPSGVQGSGARETPIAANAEPKAATSSKEILDAFASGKATLKLN